MRAFTRALALYWGTYFSGFITSAYFILLGYGYAELNQFQRAFVAAPSLTTMGPWMANQGVWLGLGVFGVLVLLRSPSYVPKGALAVALSLLSFFRIYGTATNLGFTLGAVYGFPISPTFLFVAFSTPVMALFMGDLVSYVKPALSIAEEQVTWDFGPD